MYKDQSIANKIDKLYLTEAAREFVAETPINMFYELFGENPTSEDIEELAKEYYEDSENDD